MSKTTTVRRRRIGVVALARPTFDVPLAERTASEAFAALGGLGMEIHGSPELLFDADAAREAVATLREVELDLLLILQVTFTDATMTVKFASEIDALLPRARAMRGIRGQIYFRVFFLGLPCLLISIRRPMMASISPKNRLVPVSCPAATPHGSNPTPPSVWHFARIPCSASSVHRQNSPVPRNRGRYPANRTDAQLQHATHDWPRDTAVVRPQRCRQHPPSGAHRPATPIPRRRTRLSPHAGVIVAVGHQHGGPGPP